MKKINYFVIILCLFFPVLNVKGIVCSYKNGNDTIDISIDGATMSASYTNSLGSGQPFFPMNLVYKSGNDYWFDNDSEMSGSYSTDDGYFVVACPNSIINYYKNSTKFSTDIKVEYFNASGFTAGYNSPMSMPIIFFSTSGKTNDNKNAKLTTFGHNFVTESEFKSYKKVEYNLIDQKENNSQITEEGELSCNYKNSKNTGIYNFKFKTNRSPKHQYSYNSGTYKTAILDGEDRITTCPSVIKFESNSMKRFTISSPDACFFDNELCFYEESVPPYYGSNGTPLVTYYQYNNKNNKISIFTDVSGNITVNNGTDINVSNYSEMEERILGKDYPKYILNKNGAYSFIDSIKDENGNVIEYDEVYIRSGSSEVNGTGLSDEEIISTCKQLFGDEDGGFLQFLDQYVFKAIWIGVPILLILLTSFDFAKVVFVDDKEGIAHAFGNLKKRAIVSVLIFLTPYIIILIANIVDPTQTTIQSCAKTIREMNTK